MLPSGKWKEELRLPGTEAYWTESRLTFWPMPFMPSFLPSFLPEKQATENDVSIYTADRQDCHATAHPLFPTGDAQYATYDTTSHCLASIHVVREVNSHHTSHGQQTAMTPKSPFQLYLFHVYVTALATTRIPREPAAVPQTSPTL